MDRFRDGDLGCIRLKCQCSSPFRELYSTHRKLSAEDAAYDSHRGACNVEAVAGHRYIMLSIQTCLFYWLSLLDASIHIHSPRYPSLAIDVSFSRRAIQHISPPLSVIHRQLACIITYPSNHLKLP